MESNCNCTECISVRGDSINGIPRLMCEMIVCETCGNKRCPRASNHRNDCTNSNEPGQIGSHTGMGLQTGKADMNIEQLAREAGFVIHPKNRQIRVRVDSLIWLDATEHVHRFASLVLEQAAQWQPIETAPISDALNPMHRIMMWMPGAGVAFGYVYGDGDGGIMTAPEGYSGSVWKVTHWMPLPAPPAIRAMKPIQTNEG